MVRAVNPWHLQILRVDTEGMIDDVITHGTWCHLCKNTPWLRSSRIFAVTQNTRRRCCWHCNIWPITLLLILKLHTRVCEETFNVNIKIVQTMQNIWNFIVQKASLQEMANFQWLYIREMSYSNLETRRYGPKPGVSQIIRESWQHCMGSQQMEQWTTKACFKCRATTVLNSITGWIKFDLSTAVALWSTCNCHAELNT